MAAFLSIQQLTHRFNAGLTLFGGLCAEFGPGLATVVGADGQGKTTLLRILAGELAPSEGQVLLQGVSATADPVGYQRQVFWCDPNSDRWNDQPCRAYLAAQAQQHAAGWREDVLRAHLDAMALTEHLEKPLYALSTGTRRKLRLAAAFASGAELTLLDDPLAALDRHSIEHVLDVLAACKSVDNRLVLCTFYGVPPRLGEASCVLL